jgi:hypothetical protein
VLNRWHEAEKRYKPARRWSVSIFCEKALALSQNLD